MSTNEQTQRSLTPPEIPFTTPQAMVRYVTDTGKILPRTYTGFSAKHQRAVTARSSTRAIICSRSKRSVTDPTGPPLFAPLLPGAAFFSPFAHGLPPTPVSALLPVAAPVSAPCPRLPRTTPRPTPIRR